KRRKCPTKADHNQQTPAWIEKYSFAGPNHEKAHEEASGHVDEQRSVRKDWAENSRRVAADDPTGICANNCASRNYKKVVHDGVLLTKVVGVISPHVADGCGELHRRKTAISS